MKFAHVLSPVVKPEGHELNRAQPLVFESMKYARENSRRCEVLFFAACFEEDRGIVPAWFDGVQILSRSLRDPFGRSDVPKLPVLSDIINSIPAGCDADYIIYTNCDITLVPQFYDAVTGLIRDGFDALLINRRTISDRFAHDYVLLSSEVGLPHPGYDCFVFPREWLERIHLGDCVLGVLGTDWLFAVNLWKLADRSFTVKDLHLTFHLGDDRAWRGSMQTDWWQEASRRVSCAMQVLREIHGDSPAFVWPRVPPPKRSILHRAANRLGRELVKRFPDQA